MRLTCSSVGGRASLDVLDAVGSERLSQVSSRWRDSRQASVLNLVRGEVSTQSWRETRHADVLRWVQYVAVARSAPGERAEPGSREVSTQSWMG